MSDHLVILATLGTATLLMAWLPSISQRLRVSYPIIILLIGLLIYWFGIPLAGPTALDNDLQIMTISEAIVIISLMGGGLKIGRSFDWKKWVIPVRLIGITMPLCLLAVLAAGYFWLGLPLAAAILLAAVMAPTDPVLAAEVQLEGPEEIVKTDPGDDKGDADHNAKEEQLMAKTEEGLIRFSITGEAGINDGLAYPFTFMAILVFQAGSWEAFDFWAWLGDKFFLKILIGVAFGYAVGKLLGWLLVELPETVHIRTRDGFIALSATLATYAFAELLHGYGFLAVFVTGLTLRYEERLHHEFKGRLHKFVEETERLLLVLWLIFFGGAIFNGLLANVDWQIWVFAVILIFVVRPLAGLAAFAGLALPLRDRLPISYFGIRGIGSVFYLSWAFVQVPDFPMRDELYGIVGVVILVSLVAHGLSAPFLSKWLGKYAERKPEVLD